MYLYKATCSDIPNPKQKGASKQADKGPGGPLGQGGLGGQGGQGRKCPLDSARPGARPYTPLMLWGGLRANTSLEVKQLEEFLNVHALSLQDTVMNQTHMAYR